MAFNELKTMDSQQIASVHDIELDRCRHTRPQSVLDGSIMVSSNLAAGATGVIAITGGNALSFQNSDPYLQWDNEILRVTVNSAIQLTVTARGAFGTTDAAHTAGAANVKHSGEVDGSCYGTPFTCSSPDTYLAGSTLLFRFPSTRLSVNQVFYNGFQNWRHNAGEVDPGQSMGKRSGATVNISDSIDNDNYVPYPDRRTSDGTLFTKLLARHPYLEGRRLKVHTGFDPLDLDFDNFITREYVITSAQLRNGMMTISGLDPLSMTDQEKAKAPATSRGFNTIAIDNSSSSITYGGDSALAYGAVGTSLSVRIDSEIIDVTVASDFVLTINNRGQGGTEQANHSVNSTVQINLKFTAINVVQIIEDLMRDYTNIDASFIDDYTDVKNATSSITLTANINKPTSVKTLINELIITGDLTMFYDELAQKIRIRQVSDPSVSPININEDDNIGQDSITFNRDTRNQYTRYTVAWAPNDVTKVRDEEFFSIVYQSINLDNELPARIGQPNEKDIFFNRWLTTSSEDVTKGTSIAQRLIDRNQDVPEIATFELDIQDVYTTQGSSFEQGSIINLASSRLSESNGTIKARNHQVLSIRDMGNMRYQIKSRLFQDPLTGVNVDFTISESQENYDLSANFSPVAGNYVVLIDAGVVIGSLSASIVAFTTGNQADGVTFDFINRGSIEGAGGDGGDGGNLNIAIPSEETVTGTAGGEGGAAFNATVPCTINTGSGAIWAGGGGAAGGTSTTKQPNPNNLNIVIASAGNGGSGGQGYVGGGAGDTGSVSGFVSDTGQDGNEGSRGAPGAVGQVSGGGFGEDGDIDDSSDGSAQAGPSGLAIRTNGNQVTITSGNNPLNIRGRVE